MLSVVGVEDDFNLYAYVGNDPLNKTDPSGLETEVELRYFFVNYGFVGIGHQYLYARDTKTGEALISGAHPSSKPPILDAVFDRISKARGSSENIKLQTELSSESKNSDRPQINPTTKTVPGSNITLADDIDVVKDKLEGFNKAVDSAKIDYRGQSANSNAYAGTAYEVVTGKQAPANKELKGSRVDLRPLIPQCSGSSICK